MSTWTESELRDVQSGKAQEPALALTPVRAGGMHRLALATVAPEAAEGSSKSGIGESLTLLLCSTPCWFGNN